MFEKFTDRARKVMSLARQEAQRVNHEYIGTEHLLLGLVQEGTGIAAQVLKRLDVDLKKIRIETEKLIPHGPPTVQVGQLPFTPRAKRVLELTREESEKLGHDYVGTEHVLLGLIAETEGVAAQVLMNLGLKLEDVREEIIDVLGAVGEVPQTPAWAGARRKVRAEGWLTLEEVILALAGDLACPIPEWPLTREQLGPGIVNALRHAVSLASASGARVVTPVHLLAALTSRLGPSLSRVIERHGVTHAKVLSLLRPGETRGIPATMGTQMGPEWASALAKTMERAWVIAQARGFPKLETEHIFVALLHDEDAALRELLTSLVVQVDLLRKDAEAALTTFQGSAKPAVWKPAWPLPLSAGVWGILRAAYGQGVRSRHERVGVEHLAWAIARDDEGRVAAQAALDRRPVCPRSEPPRFDLPASDCLTRARSLAIAFGHAEVGEDHLVHALLTSDDAVLHDCLALPAEEAQRRAQGAWERLHARPVVLVPCRGQAKVLAADCIGAIHRARELSPACTGIEPGDLLLSLTKASGSAAARVLARLHADAEALRLLAEPGAPHVPLSAPEGSIVLSAASVAVVAMAAEEAFALGSAHLDTDHLLLGILRSGTGPACRALACVGARLFEARIAALEETLSRQP